MLVVCELGDLVSQTPTRLRRHNNPGAMLGDHAKQLGIRICGRDAGTPSCEDVTELGGHHEICCLALLDNQMNVTEGEQGTQPLPRKEIEEVHVGQPQMRGSPLKALPC